MTSSGVILYGPPASGKDTITDSLVNLDERFMLLTKLKVGMGRSAGYRYVSAEDLDALRTSGRLAVETSRYGNRYAVDRQDIADLIKAGRVPVVHMGSVGDVETLCTTVPMEWIRVMLWIPREVCAERSRQREDTDTPARLRAWHVAEIERKRAQAVRSPLPITLTIRTDQVEPIEAARRIAAAVRDDMTSTSR